MNDKKFNAILDKNLIAEELKEARDRIFKEVKNPETKQFTIDTLNLAITYLKNLEKYLGQANQPCVEDIYYN